MADPTQITTVPMRLTPDTLGGTGGFMADTGFSVNALPWTFILHVLAVLLIPTVVLLLLIPIIAKYKRARQARRRSLGRPAVVASGPVDEVEETDVAYIPANFHFMPSAGLISRALRVDAPVPEPESASPEKPESSQSQIKALENRLTEQYECMRSQQERMAWLEERLHIMRMELRDLRQFRESESSTAA